MEFTITKQHLLELLDAIGTISSENLIVIASGGHVDIAPADLGNSLRLSYSAVVIEQGATIVPGRALLDIQVPDAESVTVKLIPKNWASGEDGNV